MTDSAHPTDLLSPLGMLEADLAPGVRQSEIFTADGRLGLLWYGPTGAERLVVACPGGMGGVLGPGHGVFPALGRRLASHGIATVTVDYRRPSRLQPSVLDAVAAIDIASQRGTSQVVAVGHSFGGAVAINVALALPAAVRGVCTLSTQSAGCEGAAGIAPRPFLLIHGDADDILPAETSTIVQQLAGGHGDVEIAAGEGHGLTGCSEQIVDRLTAWTTSILGAAGASDQPERN